MRPRAVGAYPAPARGPRRPFVATVRIEEGGRGVIGAEWFMVVFRIVHIGAGVAWVGSLFLLVVYVQPSAAAIAPAAATRP